MSTNPSAGDTIPEACRIIEVRVAELRQLFNAIDPSPFRERDLDPKAEEFIVDWSKDLPRDARLALAVHLGLVIAFGFLALSIAVGGRLAGYFQPGRTAEILREGFLIIGWVAMWRPLEVFLYDWWPIRGEARLYDRLSQMPVRIEYQQAASTDAWRSDWPAVSAADRAAIERSISSSELSDERSEASEAR